MGKANDLKAMELMQIISRLVNVATVANGGLSA